MQEYPILAALFLVAVIVSMVRVIRGPSHGPWERTIGKCQKDAGKECPYQIRVRSSGALEVDRASLFACCKFRDTCDAVNELFKRQSR